MKVQAVVDYLNEVLMPYYQESYDNSGMQVGNTRSDVTGVLVSLDVTRPVLEEAVRRGCNLIVSHHPVLFGGVKSITPATEQGRIILYAIEQGLSLYAAHTNLDNLAWGVSGELARQLNLKHCRVLHPLQGALGKLVTFCPPADADRVRQALFASGAGRFNAALANPDDGYDQCSFNSMGRGTFRAGLNAHPYCGAPSAYHEEPEERIEVLYEKRIERKVVAALLQAHPYEEPAYDLLSLQNPMPNVGSGMVGELDEAMPVMDFLQRVKAVCGTPVLRVSKALPAKVRRIAVCGGSGSSFIRDARAHQADLYLTADLKYHDMQQADEQMALVDTGHFESERYACDVLQRVISRKFRTFACFIAEGESNYTQYI